MDYLNRSGEVRDYQLNQAYLPEFIRDFHDQKELFKTIDDVLIQDERYRIDWIKAHLYSIDTFLYFMAAHGYTLQKSRKKLDFVDIQKTIKESKKRRMTLLSLVKQKRLLRRVKNEQ